MSLEWRGSKGNEGLCRLKAAWVHNVVTVQTKDNKSLQYFEKMTAGEWRSADEI